MISWCYKYLNILSKRHSDMELILNKMYRKTKRDKLMLTSSSSLLSSSKRALSQTPNSETQLKNPTARITAVKIECKKRCPTNFELMQPAETEDLPDVSPSVRFGHLGEVLHGRVEIFGQHNVGKDTLISKLLLRRPDIEERNFGGYLLSQIHSAFEHFILVYKGKGV